MRMIRLITLTITLTLLIIVLVLNITSKAVTNEIITEIWNEIIPQETVEKVKDNKVSKWFKDLSENEEVENFFDKYLNSDEVNKIKDQFSETKEQIQEELSKTVENFIKEQEEKLSPSQKFALNTYRFITNAKLKGLIIIAIIINLILIALVEKSFFKWIKNLSCSLVLSGILIILLAGWIKNTIRSVINISIRLGVLTRPGFILLISGIIIMFIYFTVSRIIKANKNNKEEKNEVS